MINKIIRRVYKKNIKILLGIGIIYAFAICFLFVANTAIPKLQSDFDQFLIDTNVQHFQLYPLSNEDIYDDVYNVEVKEEIENQYNLTIEPLTSTSVRTSEEIDVELVRFEEDNEINQILLEEGELPYNYGEVVIDVKFAEHHDISVGDTFEVEDITITVSGIGYFVDYTYAISNTTFVPNLDKFTAVYVNGETFDDLTINLVTDFKFIGRFNESLNKDERLLVYEDLSESYTIEIPEVNQVGEVQFDENFEIIYKDIPIFIYVQDVEDNTRIYKMQQDLDNNQSFLLIIGYIMFFIAAVLSIILFDNIFRSQKREIGILKSEGIQNGQITKWFIGYYLFIIIFFILIGIFLGVIVSNYIISLLLTMFTVPINSIDINVLIHSITIILILTLIMTILIYLLAIRKNLKTNILHLINDISMDSNPKINLLKNINFLNFKTKYQINILIRNWKKSLLLMFGVFVSSFLILFGGIALTSINEMVYDTYEEVYTYNYEAYYSSSFEPVEITDYTFLQYEVEIIDVDHQNSRTNTEEILNRDDTVILIFGYDPLNNDLINLKDEKGNEIPLEDYENGLVVSTLIADIYDLEIGDTITVEVPDTSEEATIEITNISNVYYYPFAYTTMENAQKLLGVDENYYNGQVGMDETKEELQELDEGVVYVPIDDIVLSIESTLIIVYFILGFIFLIAGVISVVTILIVTLIIIRDNKKIISTMKVLGYSDSEINKLSISGYKYIVIFSYFISVPIIIRLVQEIINKAVEGMEVTIPISIAPTYVIFGFVFIYVIFIISMRIALRRVKKINLAESLKK